VAESAGVKGVTSDQQARLAHVAGRQTVRLTHIGRQSGKPHEVTIWFVAHGDKVYLSTADVARQWVRNVQKTPQVKLNIGGERFEGEARFLKNPVERKRVMQLVQRKYWLFWPVMALWQLFKSLGLARDNTGAFEVTLA
jgi:deazaflavin-dependent oxidoreductase (nitroreductase family)